ncbi:flagellar protein G [Halorubrum ezzemoulense]|mgnify:FL=1|uniref:Flagellar protein G n=1 Tax=Halorubrum ezzemoulense TaxID=337243 RepID=A0A256J7G9_HALEZ|nr:MULTISPECIES: flagellar protein G [Halorubrum]MDB2238358.1 flagellar protein G [Halorubrum ezzemoulense]MDB2239979.1 flagellar protein G [Halorubrum ezzemoulense]MDB2244077.1 flagellar protein G [Halorubrum ezzemoulense]MDB2247827.1 flagellar protein G [Halorubrum ezzemoulense]MDB2260523.1 flagellar protein G [Halorubrum ezzemoulense]
MASVPVSHLILFIASLVIAAGVVGTITTGVDRVSAAVDDAGLDATEQLRTDVTIISDPSAGVYNATEGNVTLLIKNTGTYRLAPDGSDLDVVFDGGYVRPSKLSGELVSVDGANAWSRGDVLRLTIEVSEIDGVNGGLADGDHRVYLSVNGDEELFQFRVGGN